METQEVLPAVPVVWTPIPEKLSRINEKWTELGAITESTQIYPKKIKGEPILSPCPSPTREDEFSNIKAEAS